MKAVIFSRTRLKPSLGLMAIRGKEIRFQVRFQGSSLDPHPHTDPRPLRQKAELQIIEQPLP